MFSATVRLRSSDCSWNTMPMPWRGGIARRCAGAAAGRRAGSRRRRAGRRRPGSASASTCRRRSRRPGRPPRAGGSRGRHAFSAWTPGKRLSMPRRAEPACGLAHLTILRRARSSESATAAMIMQALHGLLDVGRDAHEHHAVGEHDDDQHADQRLQHAALAAGERGAADHDGGDRVNRRPSPICALPRPSWAAASTPARP